MACRGWAAAASVTAILVASQSLGQDAERYAVEGPGRMPCSDLAGIEAGSDGQRETVAWLTGYLTAHHKLLPGVFDLSAWQTPAMLYGLVRQYCVAHPDAIVERGAQELVAYLAPRALQEPAEVVAVQNGSDMALIYVPVLQEVRKRLAAAGHPPGTNEAELGQALRSYQAARGLSETSLPDQATLADLLK